MARQNHKILLAERPETEIIPGKTFETKVEPAPTESDLKDGQVLVEVLYLSLDPAMRGWLKDKRSYIEPVQIGAVMRGATVARIVASKSQRAKAGDLVLAYAGWQEYAILPEQAFEVFEMPPNAKPTDMIGAFGGTGLTAYFGLQKIGEVKPGDTVVVSGAAGATGSVVGQIAKIKGAGKVIGIAGSDEKCRWLTEELGFDVALNYKAPDFRQKFKEATPDFIDVYWDNVGGEILDMALSRANKFARFVMCGAISQYNAKDVQGPKFINNVVAMRIKMQGFIVFDFIKEYSSARKDIYQWFSEGKIKTSETIVPGGLEAAQDALVSLYKGSNTGKLLVEIKNPESKL